MTTPGNNIKQSSSQQAGKPLAELATEFLQADLGLAAINNHPVDEGKSLTMDRFESIMLSTHYETATKFFSMVREMASGKKTEANITADDFGLASKFERKASEKANDARYENLKKVMDPLKDKMESLINQKGI